MANPVFISYRRADSTGDAGRLAQSLEKEIGTKAVFRDADDIPYGDDFQRVLWRELAETKVIVVLIGKNWLAELSDRLVRPETDFVRREIATALSLGKRVIPVLLHGAKLPTAQVLPDDLRPLVNRQALSLRDEAWAADTGRLADAIGRPYSWGRLVLRAFLFVLVALPLSQHAIASLVPDSPNQLALARYLVGGLLATYATLEAGMWWKHSQRRV